MRSIPKVSVIMGIYNCADTLKEALDSLLRQTYQDFEVIMCDDGSSDDTFAIAKKYTEKHPEQFMLIKNRKNMGLNITLNNCLDIAKGEYIARMDGDDISVPDRLEKQVKFLDEHPEYALVGTGIINFDDNGEWGVRYQKEMPTKEDFVQNAVVHAHATILVRQSVFKEVGGYTVEKKMLRCEDINLWYKIYSLGYTGYNMQELLYKVRDDKNAFKRRSLKYRMNIVYVEYVGYHMFKMPIRYYPKLIWLFIRNFILGIIPWNIYMKLHRIKQNEKKYN